MSLGHGSSIVRDGLVLHLDAANVKSYPGAMGIELVTNPILLRNDDSSFNVLRTTDSNIPLPITSVVAGNYYIIKYSINDYIGSVGATLRINGSGSNLSPAIAIGSDGKFIRTFQALSSGLLSINADNTGTNFNVDAVSVRELTSSTGTSAFDVSNTKEVSALVSGVSYNGTEFVFDGTDDYINIGSNPDYNAISSITIELLFKRTAAGTAFYQVLLSNTRDCCGVYDGFQIQIPNSTVNPATISCNLWNSNNFDGTNWSSSFTPMTIPNAIGINTWHYLVYTYDLSSAIFRGYMNGELISTITKSNALSTNQASFNLFLGKSPSHNSPISGNISFCKIYNRALSAQEIKQNFEALRGRYGI